MIDTPTKSMLSEKHTSIALQQSRYEERRKYESEVNKLKSTIVDLRTKLGQVQQESEKEKSVRRTLETTYEALSQHKKELSVQLELINKSRESLEEKLETAKKSVEEEKISIAKERQEWDAQLEKLNEQSQVSLKTAKEFETRCHESLDLVASRKAQMADLETKHEETIQNHIQAKESLKTRLEEREGALRKREKQVSIMFYCV